LFQAGAELNAWRPAYRVDFGCPVVACLWLASGRKFGIGRAEGDAEGGSGSGSGSGFSERPSRWHVDTAIGISRLAFFGPRNTHGKQALVVATADGQLVLVYQRDDAWARVVSPLSPRRRDASVDDDPWSNIPTGAITHADMMLVSKKWIYLAAHRAGARTVAHPHERGAIADELKRSGAMTAPTVEVYRVQVEFASDYHPRLFATPLVVQPITLTAAEAPVAEAMAETEAGAEDLRVPRVMHVKLITALNPEALPADKNVLGENHFFPLLFVSLGRVGNPQPQSADPQPQPAGPQPQSTSNADSLPTFDTFVQVWRLEAAAHAQRSVADLLRRPPPLKLSHMWTEQRRGTLLAVNANRAERQQLRRLFARPSDTEYRALMLTWADGRVEMLRNYQDRADRFDQCVPPVQAQTHTHMRVIGSALSPHYTAYFQLVMAERTVNVGAGAGTNNGPVTCVWAQGHARFRLGWTPFFGDAPVQAYCGDLLAVRILNQEDPTDLVALLANIARHEENQPLPQPPPNSTTENTALPVPASRTLAQALLRACTLLGAALRITSLELDPLAASTPVVRRLLGAIMQTHFLAQHSIQATSVGLLLHIAAAVEARVSIVHEQVLQSAASGLAHQQLEFSAAWRRSFPATAALVLWCIDLFVALVRDTYLYLHARCPDGAGAMQRLCDLDARVDDNTDDSTDAGVVAGSLPSRLALLFHLPTLDAMRRLMAFVAQVEGDLLRRIQILNSLPPNAAVIADLAPMVQARDMVVTTAQQLAHALEALPVSMQRMKDFLAAVHDEYAADPECTALGAQAVLVASAALAAPFRKHLPGVARSFQRFILERDATAPDTPANRPAAPSALVLHDTRWLSVVACRAAAPGLPDAATVFETPWRVRLPVSVADARLIVAGADADALVPAAELVAWAREKSEFERALDEDNVLFDIDDPGFIFFDTSDAAQPLHPPPESVPPAFAAAAAHAAAQAPVRITTRVPDFSDVLAPLAAAAAARSLAADIDGLFDMPALLDSTFAAAAATATAADSSSSARMRARSSSSSATTHSPCATPHTTASFAWPPPGAAPGFALASASGSASAQHFVPHYSSVASAWAATAGAGASEELSSGWQFISTPRDPKLHIPTLLGQHAYSLAVLHQKRTRAPAAVGGGGGGGGKSGDDDDNDDIMDGGEATGDGLDDFVVDDDGAGYAERQEPRWMAVGDPTTHCFQPGSTPWIGDRRYLAFNMVGSIVSIAQDDAHNTIEVEFYDKSMHRDFHFSDSFKFSMAALSESGCLLATTSRELANDQSLRGALDADEASVISYRGLASWSSNSDWMFRMPAKEHPRCIATSAHGAAVITSLGMLRLFTCGGVQRHIESLPNRVVTCTAHGDMLLIVMEGLGTIKSSTGSRRLEYEYVLMSMDGQSRLAAGFCPVAPASEIVWAGFSEEGHPATGDSKGMVRVLHKYWAAMDACWVPVLDSRKVSLDRGRREAYWPVALSAKQLIAVTCKGKSRFPPFPKPILDEIDVEIPLLQSDSHTAQQEAKYLSTSVFYEQQCGEAERTGSEYPGGKASQARDALEQDKLLLRLVQLASKSDKTQRAIDLALLIRLETSFDAAIKIAVHQKQSLLAERLMRLKEPKFSSNADDDDEVEEEEDVDMESDGQKGFRSSTAVAAAVARPHQMKTHRRLAATYGRGKQSDSEDSVGGDEDDVFANGGAVSDNDDGSGADVGLTIARPPRSLLQQAARTSSSSARDLVTRPTQAPTTSKPFNPFGVVSPSKSMEIKRSDSFFNAADAHSSALSREASAANLGGGSLTTTTKRRNQLVADDDDGSAGPRKLAKKAAAAAAADSSSGTKDRAQSKLFAFAFKRDDSKSGATSALPKPMAAAAGASENGDCNGNEDIISDVNCDGDDVAFAD
ncbi:DNA polymerase alpha accessory factor Mcl1, partial [Kickxella alabastrina]